MHAIECDRSEMCNRKRRRLNVHLWKLQSSSHLLIHAASLSVLVRVRDAHELRNIRTYTEEQLKPPTERCDVFITGLCMSADGDTLLCADRNTASVKGVELATGSLSTLYTETASESWWVSNACIAVRPDGTQELIVVESGQGDYTWKRMLVADRLTTADIFTRTYQIQWTSDTDVCCFEWTCWDHHILLPASTRPSPEPPAFPRICSSPLATITQMILPFTF